MLLLNSKVLASKIKKLNIPLLPEVFIGTEISSDKKSKNKSKPPKRGTQNLKPEFINVLKKWTNLNYLSVNSKEPEIISFLRKELPYCFIPVFLRKKLPYCFTPLQQEIIGGNEQHLNRILFYNY